jgi:hypothetical protein
MKPLYIFFLCVLFKGICRDQGVSYRIIKIRIPRVMGATNPKGVDNVSSRRIV